MESSNREEMTKRLYRSRECFFIQNRLLTLKAKFV